VFIVATTFADEAGCEIPEQELNPGTTEQDAAEAVTSAADAIFALLEQAGFLIGARGTAVAAY
jgi:hypothetical protein